MGARLEPAKVSDESTFCLQRLRSPMDLTRAVPVPPSDATLDGETGEHHYLRPTHAER
jgi:hypothetical protein